MQYGGIYTTSLGEIGIIANKCAITQLFLCAFNVPLSQKVTLLSQNALTHNAALQVQEYLNGERRDFNLPLAPNGTSFQKSVWEALCAIAYGEVRSYKDIAKSIQAPRAQRAVGAANHHNPIAFIIPCHRVIKSNGSLGGYAYGVELKQRLLDLERDNKSLFV